MFGVERAVHRRRRRLERDRESSCRAGQLGFFVSISFLVGIVVGGLASVSGAIYGALFIQFVPNVADHLSKSAPWAVYGAFLIAFMYSCRRASPARCT